MKQTITILCIIGFVFCAAADSVSNKKIGDFPNVVWAGLDYSKVRMIGGCGFEHDFVIPDLIFPGMLEKWNQLFLDERLEKVAHALGKTMSVDINGVNELNKTASASQITLTPGPKDTIEETHLTSKDIADEVRSYKMAKTNGLALVFIVDRLVCRKMLAPTNPRFKQGQKCDAAVYVVFFDISTREVISAKREVHGFFSNSGSFRNFWFGPIKTTDETLGKYRK